MRSLVFLTLFLVVFSNAVQARRGIFGEIIGEVVGKTIGKIGSEAFSKEPKLTPELIMAAQKEVANELNAKCPITVEKYARLDRVSVSGMSVIYHYTKDISSNMFSSNANANVKIMRDFFNQTLKSEQCLNFAETIPFGAEYVYSFSSSDGIEIARFSINSNSCANKEDGCFFPTITKQNRFPQPATPAYVPPAPVYSTERPAFSPYKPPAPTYEPEIPTQELLAKQEAQKLLIDATPSDAEAQYRLGMQYYDGAGVEQNHPEAARLLLLSARQGNVDAQSNIGVLYYLGDGIKQDNKQALYWIRKAVEVDNMNAQNNLGVLFYDGRALKKNDFKAQFWFDKAAAQGDSHATEALSLFKDNL